MSEKINRRDFLKLASLLPLAYVVPSLLLGAECQASPDKPNFLVLVFDAWSAFNNSLYGYPRNTTPNLKKLAEKAIVYHNHNSGAPFTSPGTATLLTGVLPWTHRAFNKSALTAEEFVNKNLFSVFPEYYRAGYSHNPYAVNFLDQFSTSIEQNVPRQDLFMEPDWGVSELLANDFDTASLSRHQILDPADSITNSLYMSQVYKATTIKHKHELAESYREMYPLGLPHIEQNNYYLLEDGIDWLGKALEKFPQPNLSYFHFLPPHDPYNTREEFHRSFMDGWMPEPKPYHLFQFTDEEHMRRERRQYDEFIALVDFEFNRLMRMLEENGTLDNTWVILTSDHGEMFERGITKHSHETLHEPVVRVPLVIFPPGQKERVDIYTPTSSIDILPTLLQISGQEIPTWAEGQVLPPFNTSPQGDRRLFSIHLRGSPQFGPATQGTLNIYRERYKLMYFFGYEKLAGKPLFELYDLESDPDEYENLYESKKGLAEELLEELLGELERVEKQVGIQVDK